MDTQDVAPGRELTAKGKEKAEKESRSRARQCFEGELTHLKIGDWRGLHGATVSLVGTAAQLHGSVCTCCPRRAQ